MNNSVNLFRPLEAIEYCACNGYTICALIYSMHHLRTNLIATAQIGLYKINQKIELRTYSL